MILDQIINQNFQGVATVLTVIVVIIILILYFSGAFKSKFTNTVPKEVIYFRSKQCIHCVDFEPEWKKLKEMNKNVKFIDYTYETQMDMFEKHKISKTPTIFINGVLYKGKNTAKDIQKKI